MVCMVHTNHFCEIRRPLLARGHQAVKGSFPLLLFYSGPRDRTFTINQLRYLGFSVRSCCHTLRNPVSDYLQIVLLGAALENRLLSGPGAAHQLKTWFLSEEVSQSLLLCPAQNLVSQWGAVHALRNPDSVQLKTWFLSGELSMH